MDLPELMKQFEAIGYASIGKGPAHPDGNPELKHEIQDFLKEYPRIAQDAGLVSFLEYYSAYRLASRSTDRSDSWFFGRHYITY